MRALSLAPPIPFVQNENSSRTREDHLTILGTGTGTLRDALESIIVFRRPPSRKNRAAPANKQKQPTGAVPYLPARAQDKKSIGPRYHAAR